MATSKLSFRARALDANRPMQVYLADELPDLAECTPINRAVAQMPTGMEKDEEMVSTCFHHLPCRRRRWREIQTHD